jgi:hypothetical protein
MNRRSFIGAMLAAAAAPAYVKAGILMPVKKIIVPGPILVPMLMNGGMLWQDMARTIPVTAIGQPVAVVDHLHQQDGRWHPAVQPTMARRPVFDIHDGQACVKYDGVDDLLLTLPPHPPIIDRRIRWTPL